MSKKKYEQFRVIRDSREKKNHGWTFRSTSSCLGTEIKKLDTGDYSIEGFEHLIMIERKSLDDLWGSLTYGRERFLKEMERAKQIPARYLVIEGTLKDVLAGSKFSAVSGEYILSNLFSLENKYGIRVIFTDKRHDVSQTYMRNLLKKLYQYCVDGIISK